MNDAGSRLSRTVGRWLQRLLRHGHTREDLFEILRESGRQGLLERDALDIIERVVQTSQLRVRDIMIPRAQMVVLDKDDSLKEILPVIIESAHSRFPVTGGDRDKVAGILLAKDLLRFSVDDAGAFSWRDILRPAASIPESKRLNVLLTEFRASRNHMAIVVDEYGGVAGLVTIEDVLEQIVGEIEDEHDYDEEEAMVLDRGNDEYVVKAVIDLEDFNELVGASLDRDESHTLGGAVVSHLGHVPQQGESARFSGFEFEVLNADSRRVHLLRVTRLDKRPAA